MQGQKRVFRSFFLEQVKYFTLFDLFQVAEYSQWNTILESLKIKKKSSYNYQLFVERALDLT